MEKRKISAIFASIFGLLYSNSAQALTIPCASGTIFTGCSFDEISATGNFFDKVLGGFDNHYTVSLSQAGLLKITITLTKTPDNISFSTLEFDGQPFTVGTVGTAFLRPAGIYDLHLVGTATLRASFSGTIDLANAVPEPASWALTILGFGTVGMAMRRRSVRIAFA